MHGSGQPCSYIPPLTPTPTHAHKPRVRTYLSWQKPARPPRQSSVLYTHPQWGQSGSQPLSPPLNCGKTHATVSRVRGFWLALKSGLFSLIFWEQGFDKVRESSRIPWTVRTVRCAISKMEDICWFLWSYSSKTCLNCLNYIQYITINQYTKNQNVWQPSKASSRIFDYNSGCKNSSKGHSTHF